MMLMAASVSTHHVWNQRNRMKLKQRLNLELRSSSSEDPIVRLVPVWCGWNAVGRSDFGPVPNGCQCVWVCVAELRWRPARPHSCKVLRRDETRATWTWFESFPNPESSYKFHRHRRSQNKSSATVASDQKRKWRWNLGFWMQVLLVHALLYSTSSSSPSCLCPQVFSRTRTRFLIETHGMKSPQCSIVTPLKSQNQELGPENHFNHLKHPKTFKTI